MSIRILPQQVAARIAAGEVIERPSSAVKELVENALDASATSVEVQVSGDRLGRIVVRDDGIGMEPSDLGMCLLRHATSKLPDDRVIEPVTLGFRGEALPSIAAVASVRVTSRPPGQDVAFSVSSRDGSIAPPRPTSGGFGTSVSVDDLFENQPTRLKFLKSRKAEAARIREVVEAAALSSPTVAFRLSLAGYECRYPARTSLKERAADVLGAGFAAAVEASVSAPDGTIVNAVACLPAAKSRPGEFHLSVNGRPVRDRAASSAAQSAYASFFGPDRRPMCVVSVSADPSRVDVNVHPRKAEVRFLDHASVASMVNAAVTKALGAAGLPSGGLGGIPGSSFLGDAVPTDDRISMPLGRLLGQAGKSWLVTETEDGIAIVDQHAAHERVLMERLRSGLGRQASIRLTQPVTVPCSPSAAATVSECSPDLGAVGFEIRAEVRHAELLAVPAILADADPFAIAAALVGRAEGGALAGAAKSAMWETLATAGCRAAVKAGQRLDEASADALLREIEATPAAGRCNHGRPTVLRLSHEEIARLFGR